MQNKLLCSCTGCLLGIPYRSGGIVQTLIVAGSVVWIAIVSWRMVCQMTASIIVACSDGDSAISRVAIGLMGVIVSILGAAVACIPAAIIIWLASRAQEH